MALKGWSESLGARGIQTDVKVVPTAKAGIALMLGSQSDYAQLASNSVAWVLDWDITASGITAAELVMGVTQEKTAANYFARLRPLAPGDTFRTDQLASASEAGAIDGTIAPNVLLGVDPLTGKIRTKLATDTELFRLASDGGNLFNEDGSIWVEVVRLA